MSRFQQATNCQSTKQEKQQSPEAKRCWEKDGCMKYRKSRNDVEQPNITASRNRGMFFTGKLAMCLAVLVLAAASQAAAQTDGIMMVQNITTPRGGVWLASSTPNT